MIFSLGILMFVVTYIAKAKGEIHRSSLEANDVDPLSRIRDLIRAARTESGEVNLNVLLSENVQDPVPLADFNITSHIYMSRINGRFTHLQMHGLKTLQLDKLDIDFSQMTLRVVMSVPVLSVVGRYSVDGTVGVLPLSGEGPFYMNFSSVDLVGNSLVRATEPGRLAMGDVQMESSKVRNVALHFDNLMGGSPLGSLYNTFMSQVTEPILGELKPTLLRELSSYLKYQFDEVLFRQLPAGFVDTSTASMVDSVLQQSANLMRGTMEPVPLPDDVLIFNHRFYFDNIRAVLDIYDGSLHGLSTLARRGGVSTAFANNTIVFEAGFELRDLNGSYLWYLSTLGFRGRLGIRVKSVEGSIRIKQELKSGSRMEMDHFLVHEIRNVKLDLEGAGIWNQMAQDWINLFKDGLKRHISDTVTVPLKKGIQEQLHNINLGLD